MLRACRTYLCRHERQIYGQNLFDAREAAIVLVPSCANFSRELSALRRFVLVTRGVLVIVQVFFGLRCAALGHGVEHGARAETQENTQQNNGRNAHAHPLERDVRVREARVQLRKHHPARALHRERSDDRHRRRRGEASEH